MQGSPIYSQPCKYCTKCGPPSSFGYMAANGTIAEEFQNEKLVHIIDFEIAQGALIQALAALPGDPPHLQITRVDDPASGLGGMSPTGGVELVGQRVMLEQQPGEAFTVNFALQLHHTPDESVCANSPWYWMFQMVKGLHLKVVTLVEQEANTNTAPFFPRFMEALSYYSAIFESLDITLSCESQDHVNVEQQCLAPNLANPYPLSSSVNHTIKTLLESYSDKYRLKEEGGALILG
ncbi:unnamed protein product [Sphagnum jensenii]|uniref:Uncharacterized protein n=1 Tax=Sphagnum jensenii TaxID=128206 RepID=A0ABP0VSX2_9BRYO